MDIDCPHCCTPIKQELREITVQGSRPCPSCQRQILFSGKFLIRVLRKIETARTASHQRLLSS
jgi:hypothetical protein